MRKRAILIGALVLLIAAGALGTWLAVRALQPTAVPADELKVGFWNIRDFSAKSRDADALRKIATIAHPMDCLAVCELNDTVVLKKLADELAAIGGQWAAIQSASKAGNTTHSAEYYGFVYRSDKLRVRSPPRLLEKVRCRVKGERQLHPFDREPCTASFATLDGRLDFTLIVVHVTWGPDVKGPEYRRAEVRALREYFLQVRDADPGDKDILLGGDFNVSSGDPSLEDLLAIPSIIDTAEPGTPTLIRGLHTYDHILFQREFVREYTGRHGVERFDETLFGNDDVKASRQCSDHRPVWIVLKVPEKDDD